MGHDAVENHLSCRSWSSSALCTLHLLRKAIAHFGEHKTSIQGSLSAPSPFLWRSQARGGVTVVVTLQLVQLGFYFGWRVVTVITSFSLAFLLLASLHNQLCCCWETPWCSSEMSMYCHRSMWEGLVSTPRWLKHEIVNCDYKVTGQDKIYFAVWLFGFFNKSFVLLPVNYSNGGRNCLTTQ